MADTQIPCPTGPSDPEKSRKPEKSLVEVIALQENAPEAAGEAGTKITAVWSQKGGVGKTALAVNLAERTAALGYDTLLLDADPQGHATFNLGYVAEREDQMFWLPFLSDHYTLPPIVSTVYPRLDLGSCGPVMNARWSSLKSSEAAFLDFIERLRRGELYGGVQYRQIYIDCAGGYAGDKYNRWSLIAADEVVIPLPLCAQGLDIDFGAQLDLIDGFRAEYGYPPLRVRAVAPVALGHRSRAQDDIRESGVIEAMARQLGAETLPEWKASSVVAHALKMRAPLGAYRPSSSQRPAYRRQLELLTAMAQRLAEPERHSGL